MKNFRNKLYPNKKKFGCKSCGWYGHDYETNKGFCTLNMEELPYFLLQLLCSNYDNEGKEN